MGRPMGLASEIRLDLMTLPLNRCWCFVSVESLGSPPDSTVTGAQRHLLEGLVVKNPAAIIEGETWMLPASPGSCLLTLAGFWTRGCSFDLLIPREGRRHRGSCLEPGSVAQGDAKALAAGSCLLLSLLASPVVSLQALLDTRAIKLNPQPLCSNLTLFLISHLAKLHAFCGLTVFSLRSDSFPSLLPPCPC